MRRTLACLLVIAGIGVAARPCGANPEQVTLQSALVWRTDGSGDYPLQELKPGTTYALPEAIATAGQIETLTATWTFEGQVTLELSADGGLHYAPVLYGVPLASGFSRGNRLKWRATLGPESSLSETRVVYTDGSKILGSFGDPRLSGFRYRKPIAINGSAAGTLFGYQLALAIGESAETAAYDAHCEGRLRSDFADIRITTADGQTVLPHYLETIVGGTPARLAMVWVKIPQLPPEGLTLYLYYGNPTAPDLSDGQAVFEFFDDFKGSDLDPKRWDTHLEGQGGATVSDSQLHLTSASILSTAFQMTDGIVEYLATTTTAQDDARLIIRSDPQATHPDETNQVAYASAYAGAEHVLAAGSIVQANDPQPIAAGTPYGYQVLARGTTLTFQRYDPEFTDVQATVTFDDASGLTQGVVGLHSDGSASYDWIRVRKSAPTVVGAPEVAATTAPAPEELVNLPVFTNTLVMPNGDLGLADPALEGLYETADIPTDVAARILIPGWQGQAAAVAVSADGGGSYLRDCVAGVRYYASKGHFTPGKHLMMQVAMQGTAESPTPQLQALSLDYAAGKLFVVSPNGGERLIQGTTHQIIWSALGHDAAYPVKLEYSLDGGKTYKAMADSTENDGAYVWVLPDRVTSSEARVRVSDRNDPSMFDESDEPFAILSADEAAQGGAAQEETAQTGASYTDDLLTLLDTLAKDPNGTPHDIAVKVTESGNYKAGDIVLIRPAGTEWSEAEKNSFLIIQANLGPEAIASLMNRKFKIDLSFFDLKPRASDRGKPPVRRHYKAKEDLRTLVEDREPLNGAK
ncbi:MAG: DUF2341 domain-containing protein [Candidatus Omnitrophica bacterium]|nr:DUF2341 domain-containing protein [Candidatus Omnitrophota bacterium]